MSRGVSLIEKYHLPFSKMQFNREKNIKTNTNVRVGLITATNTIV